MTTYSDDHDDDDHEDFEDEEDDAFTDICKEKTATAAAPGKHSNCWCTIGSPSVKKTRLASVQAAAARPCRPSPEPKSNTRFPENSCWFWTMYHASACHSIATEDARIVSAV